MASNRSTVSLSHRAAQVFDRLTTDQRRYLSRLVLMSPPRIAPDYALRRGYSGSANIRSVYRLPQVDNKLVPSIFPTRSAMYEWALLTYEGAFTANLLLSLEDMQMLGNLWPEP